MSQQFKSGRFSKVEVDLIRQMVEQGLSYEQISEKVNRPPERIQEIVENHLMMNLSEDARNIKQAENNIKTSPEWRELCLQLLDDEQDMFLHHWREIVAQFKNDVTHTEKLQIIDVIRTEIFLNRVLKKIQHANIKSLEAYQLYQIEFEKEDRDADKLVEFQTTISDVTEAIGRMNREAEILAGRKQTILKDMKATREQRVKRIEESKDTLQAWVAALVASPELRRDMGITMEKNRIAKDVELIRLSEYFQYIDNTVEQPILNAKTLLPDNV